MRRPLVVALFACACAAPPAPAPRAITSAEMHAATLALVGGVVHGARAAAIAVRGDRIVAVGRDEEVRRWVGPDTRVVALGGRSVVASLTDAHGHLAGLGALAGQVDLRGCETPAACAERARKHAAATKSPWVRGRGWDQTWFPAKEFP